MPGSATPPSTASASPRALAPLAPLSNPISPIDPLSPVTKGFTNKEWVVPPRPRPGRKPATDTPPTKRKAQNRAAQRAFRERRTAKVGELEEQIKQMEEEDEREQEEQRSQVRKLEVEVERYHQSLVAWRERTQSLEKELTEERSHRYSLQKKIQRLLEQPTPTTITTDAVPLPSKRTDRNDVKGGDFQSGREQDVAMGCGKCSLGSRCECIEQAFDIKNMITDDTDQAPKRVHSPDLDNDRKIVRHKTNTASNALDETEIDFTTRPAPQRDTSSQPGRAQSVPTSRLDSCGFCQGSSVCLCAEIANQNAIDSSGLPRGVSKQSSFTTPRVPTGLTIPEESFSTSNTCENGPGSCTQCQTDPTSTLFCKSLSASRSSNMATSSDDANNTKDCGNPTGCCRTRSSRPLSQHLPSPPSSSAGTSFTTINSNSADALRTTSMTGPTLSCADAFTTLSRHHAFHRASEELGAWLPQLATLPPIQPGADGMGGRTAFEVEAASVMGVLRLFDRRFGSKDEDRSGNRNDAAKEGK
ncbi:hypothetical protein MMC09_001140 [Bachmanniomyces sp. S44760]|nr:hypothetical protein [Bachmanniomyces sp. S44760]